MKGKGECEMGIKQEIVIHNMEYSNGRISILIHILAGSSKRK